VRAAAVGHKQRVGEQTGGPSGISHLLLRAASSSRTAAAAALLVGCLACPPSSLALVKGNSPYAPEALHDRGRPPVEVPTDGGATAVLDYGRVLAPETCRQLEAEVDGLQKRSGWKLRIITGYGPNSTPSVPVLQRYWAADSKTIIVSWDEFKGNVLEFFYPDSMFETVPRNVFQELRGRFGNKYFIDEEGTEAAVKRVTGVLDNCLAAGGCAFVPGLSEQQRLFSLVPITSGAFLSGGALRNGVNNRWAFIFLLMWTPWIVGFGYYPLYIRQPDDVTPLLENTAIFVLIFAVTLSSPILNDAANAPFRRLLSGGKSSTAAVADTKGTQREQEEEGKPLVAANKKQDE